MKRFFILTISIIAFAGCSKDLWDCNGRTSKSAMEVMTSAEYWQEVRTHHYTEPNGGGDEYVSYKSDILYDGHSVKTIVVMDNKLIKYYSYVAPPANPYYVEFIMEDLGNGMYSIKRESRDYYWKILSYDEDNLKIETDSYSIYHGGDQEYSYARVHFKRQTAPYPNWKDFYISYEEMLQQKEDEKNNQ